MIKTKLMTSRDDNIRSIQQCAAKILKTDGPAGFFKGGAIRVANISFLSVIFFSVYELFLTRIDL